MADVDDEYDVAGEVLDADAAEVLAAPFADLLPGLSVPPERRARLLTAVSALPLKYAPFFDRLSELWGLSAAEVQAELSILRDRGWRWAWPGIRYFNVAASERLDERARLLRFEAGVRFPAHRHDGEESVLVLEGSYPDSGGRVVRAGDTQRMSEGSEHSLQIADTGPCVAAISQRGLTFQGALLGRLGRLAAWGRAPRR
jgi:hypothetical protein